MDNEELARLIYAERTQVAEQARRKSAPPPPYYMLNINHPLIRKLYDRWKAAKGIHRGDPPSDQERTEFELALLNAATRREMAAHYERLADRRQSIGLDQQNGGTDGKNDL